MNTTRFLLLILLLLILILYRPRALWQQFQRVWGQRDYVIKVVATVVGFYFIYGLYRMYTEGTFSTLFNW